MTRLVIQRDWRATALRAVGAIGVLVLVFAMFYLIARALTS